MRFTKNARTSATDLFFTLALFGLFAASSFFLIIIGVRVYQSSVTVMEDTYSTGTALAYIAEKIRQHDQAGAVTLAQLEGETALVLKDTVEEESYLTYIYSDGTYLRELSVREGRPVSVDLGEKILEVEDFSITDRENGFWEFSASGKNGDPVSLLLHLRSETL